MKLSTLTGNNGKYIREMLKINFEQTEGKLNIMHNVSLKRLKTEEKRKIKKDDDYLVNFNSSYFIINTNKKNLSEIYTDKMIVCVC